MGSDVHGKLEKQTFKDIQIALSPPCVRVTELLKQDLNLEVVICVV